MDLLIKLFGSDNAKKALEYLKKEIPNMHEDYYIRNAIRMLN